MTSGDLNVLLSGVVGSTAYGLAHADSDVDVLGVYAADPEDFFGLHPVAESVVDHEPDVTMHEVKKFLRLVMKGNPSVIELLWLPIETYQVMTPLGYELICLRNELISAKRVRDSYMGYASGQVDRIRNRLTHKLTDDDRAKVAKGARHIFRLVRQGFELYATGQLTVALPEELVIECREFGDRIAAGGIGEADGMMDLFRERFDWTLTALPREPNEAAAERWLVDMYKNMLLRPVG